MEYTIKTKLKERNPDEVFFIFDEKYIVCETDRNECMGCDVYDLIHSCEAYDVGECSCLNRKDRINVIFKRIKT